MPTESRRKDEDLTWPVEDAKIIKMVTQADKISSVCLTPESRKLKTIS